jgi:hypothetical protein
MRNFFYLALLLLLTGPGVMAQTEPQPPPDRDFIFEGQDRADYTQYCELFMGRGDACENLLRRLCPKIQYDRKDCAALAARDCQIKNLAKQEEYERTCSKGIQADHCYGNSRRCEHEEETACLRNSYEPRYCGHYRWLNCEKLGRDGQGEFKTKSCRIFHNETMTRWWEDKIGERLSWNAYGEQNIKQKLEIIKSQRDQLEGQLSSVRKQIDSLEGALQDALGAVLDDIRKQREELRKTEKKLESAIREIEVKQREYQHMRGVCEATKAK